MPIAQHYESLWIVPQTAGRVFLGVTMATVALGAQTGPAARPHGYGPPPVPAPSSLLLVLAGLIGVVAWNWWRSRSRAQQTSRD